MLHVAGGMERFLELAGADPVAIVGTRRADQLRDRGGRDARSRGQRQRPERGERHGARRRRERRIAARWPAVAARSLCCPGARRSPIRRQNRQLHSQILRHGVAVSEFGPGTSLRKWTLIARNRIIAALSRADDRGAGPGRFGGAADRRLCQTVWPYRRGGARSGGGAPVGGTSHAAARRRRADPGPAGRPGRGLRRRGAGGRRSRAGGTCAASNERCSRRSSPARTRSRRSRAQASRPVSCFRRWPSSSWPVACAGRWAGNTSRSGSPGRAARIRRGRLAQAGHVVRQLSRYALSSLLCF